MVVTFWMADEIEGMKLTKGRFMMMVLKPRVVSDELKLFRSINARMNLGVKEKQQYINLEKGYEGEVEFDKMVAQLDSEYLILNDLLLECQGSLFQIDSLLISLDTLYLFEVKNSEGDYVVKGSIWSSITGAEIKNPLNQLERSESLLRRLLQQFHSSLTINPYVVFVNPEFYLYQAPVNKSIIFPTQLKRLMRNLDKNKANVNDKHMQLARKLLSEHRTLSPYTRLPHYSFEEMKKGILCGCCRSLETIYDGLRVVCVTCGAVEELDSAILRSAEEFMLLFPDKKLTTNALLEWCKVVESRKTIKRVLLKNYNRIGHGKYSYYIKS